ncbi:hypothetical protein GDO78_011183 [Eleutherodactylus coqui]|uniref:Secreted protein n=1 Tax=Eleutherodactylus coqui TaxID=57060 RepID=A0A8J6F694_ELECQ|nr:hypothetical protein GDO78_011183 [Eleutherodactylus coqui]
MCLSEYTRSSLVCMFLLAYILHFSVPSCMSYLVCKQVLQLCVEIPHHFHDYCLKRFYQTFGYEICSAHFQNLNVRKKNVHIPT